jgi:exopolysaccharide biosynthesis protein
VWLVVVDGRFPGEAEGMSIAELTTLAEKLGLVEALNLDGGGSSTLWTLPGGVLNHPCDNGQFDHVGQRIVPNAVVVR